MKQHPDIYMSPVKEPHFYGYENAPPNSQGPDDFVNTAVTNLDAYLMLFKDVKDEIAIGEASPTYLYLPRAVERIHHHIPEVKLIAILRQPADRAFSAYMHAIRDQRETEDDFSKALALEEERIARNWGPLWHFKKLGCYYEQLARYYSRFDRDQIHVYLHDDFSANPISVLQGIFRFVKVDASFVPDTRVKANVSGVQKSKTVSRLINAFFTKPNPVRFAARRVIPEDRRWLFTSTVRNRNLSRQSMSPEIRRELTDYFRADILRLQDLIERDLTHWLAEE
jgi:hypothetical protein